MNRSQELYRAAKRYIPGGVNSPVRAFRSVDLEPIFISRGEGSKIWDVDNNQYIDFVMSWGPLILGHSNKRVVKAVKSILDNGSSYGAPTEIEVKIARLVVDMVPSIEKVRMVNSGTEATMSAIRLARAFTKRDIILKFNGCYHGHSDSFLIKAGSGSMTFSIPNSPGVPEDIAKNTVIAEYNDLEGVKAVLSKSKNRIAAIIVEPVAANMGLVLPEEEFLKGLREITLEEGILLIFDEVITGFRLSKGGAQKFYNIMPDITTLGKIIGGGFPVGAYGGKSEIMDMVSPDGPVYQAGTLSGNPIAMTAGYETLKIIDENKNFYNSIEEKGKLLETGIKENIKSLGLNNTIQFVRIGSMSCLFFNDKKVSNAKLVSNSDTKIFSKYFKEMINRGMYIPPSQFETSFISIAHTTEDIEKMIEANFSSLKSIL